MAGDAIQDEDWARFSAELGRTLHRLRVGAGLSQEKLAYASGLSRYTYQKFEKGESRPGEPADPRLRTLAAIAGSLGVSVGELLPGWVPDVRP